MLKLGVHKRSFINERNNFILHQISFYVPTNLQRIKVQGLLRKFSMLCMCVARVEVFFIYFSSYIHTYGCVHATFIGGKCIKFSLGIRKRGCMVRCV